MRRIDLDPNPGRTRRAQVKSLSSEKEELERWQTEHAQAGHEAPFAMTEIQSSKMLCTYTTR